MQMFCSIVALPLAGSGAGAVSHTGQEGQRRLGESHLVSPFLLVMCTEQSLWLTNSCVFETRSGVTKEG